LQSSSFIRIILIIEIGSISSMMRIKANDRENKKSPSLQTPHQSRSSGDKGERGKKLGNRNPATLPEMCPSKADKSPSQKA
jgi:hypothetical protein